MEDIMFGLSATTKMGVVGIAGLITGMVIQGVRGKLKKNVKTPVMVVTPPVAEAAAPAQ
jgi:hypothetical protein